MQQLSNPVVKQPRKEFLPEKSNTPKNSFQLLYKTNLLYFVLLVEGFYIKVIPWAGNTKPSVSQIWIGKYG